MPHHNLLLYSPWYDGQRPVWCYFSLASWYTTVCRHWSPQFPVVYNVRNVISTNCILTILVATVYTWSKTRTPSQSHSMCNSIAISRWSYHIHSVLKDGSHYIPIQIHLIFHGQSTVPHGILVTRQLHLTDANNRPHLETAANTASDQTTTLAHNNFCMGGKKRKILSYQQTLFLTFSSPQETLHLACKFVIFCYISLVLDTYTITTMANITDSLDIGHNINYIIGLPTYLLCTSFPVQEACVVSGVPRRNPPIVGGYVQGAVSCVLQTCELNLSRTLQNKALCSQLWAV